MLRLWFVFNMLRRLLMLMLRNLLLIQMSVNSSRTCLAIAVTDGNATDNILTLRSLRTAMRSGVTVCVGLTARVSLMRTLYNSRRRLRAMKKKKKSNRIKHLEEARTVNFSILEIIKPRNKSRLLA